MLELVKMGNIKKTTIILLAIFLLAFALRVLVAGNVDVKPDEMIYSVIPYNIISADQLGTVEQSILYFYVKDLGYKALGGVTAVSSRIPSILFGALATFVVYLLSLEIFRNRKVGMTSAFLFAISGYAIKYNYEMDMMAYCLILLSALFLVRYLKGNPKNLYLCGVFLALSVLTKNITAIFVFVFAIILLFHWKKELSGGEKLPKIVKQVIVVSVIVLVLISPLFIYNYFTYQEHGTTDYYFSNILGIGDSVHSNQNKAWEVGRLWNVVKEKVGEFLRYDFILVLLGLAGVAYGFRKNKLATVALIVPAFLITLYLGGITGSPTHYTIISLVLAVFAGPPFVKLVLNLKRKINLKNTMSVIVLIALVINILLLGNLLTEESAIVSLRSYVHKNVPDDAVVVLDPRIYRGIYAWVLNDKHYLEGTSFPQLLQDINNANIPTQEMDVYYIECGLGTTCAWSTEDYNRISNFGISLTNEFKRIGEQVGHIDGSNGRYGEQHNFFIYKARLPLPPSIIENIDRSKVFWYYPVGWKYPELAVDHYTTTGSGKLLNGFGFLVLYLDVLLALLTIPYVFWLVFRRRPSQS